MCGILGLIHKSDYSISLDQFKNLNLLNYNRGPDFQSVKDLKISDYNLKLGHTRLSIQDLSNNANQPMVSFSKRFLISFNGEIYNHFKLRKLLELKNFNNWKTTSDTETLVNLFEFFEYPDVLNMIEGMFSFILIDCKKNLLFISRDLAGEKPLYFHLNNSLIIASSDLNAIKNLPGFDKTINKKAFFQFLEYGYVPYPKTIFDNSFKLPPASFLEINLNSFVFKKINTFNDLVDDPSVNYKNWWKLKNNKGEYKNINNYEIEELVKNKLTKSVKSQLISDAPLGAFLSSGIDSSLIVSLMQNIQSNTKTFTIGYDNKNFDESNQSQKIANYLSTKHTNYIFNNNEIINYIQNTQNVFSEPFADSSQLPTLLVSKLAKEQVKVVLTGDGGDELFGGYNRYIYANKYWKYFNLLNPKIINFLLRNFIKFLPNNNYEILSKVFGVNLNRYSLDKINSKLSKIKDERTYYNSLTKEWTSDDNLINFNIDFNNDELKNKIFDDKTYTFEEKMMIADFFHYLPDDILCKVDRSTMFNSLESRAPFLNKELIELSFNLPLKFKLDQGNSKIILKKILSKFLPDELITQKKIGFGVPIGELMKTDLKNWTKEILSETNCKKHNFYNYDIVKKTLDNHFNNISNNQFKLWSLIQFNLWYENL